MILDCPKFADECFDFVPQIGVAGVANPYANCDICKGFPQSCDDLWVNVTTPLGHDAVCAKNLFGTTFDACKTCTKGPNMCPLDVRNPMVPEQLPYLCHFKFEGTDTSQNDQLEKSMRMPRYNMSSFEYEACGKCHPTIENGTVCGAAKEFIDWYLENALEPGTSASDDQLLKLNCGGMDWMPEMKLFSNCSACVPILNASSTTEPKPLPCPASIDNSTASTLNVTCHMVYAGTNYQGNPQYATCTQCHSVVENDQYNVCQDWMNMMAESGSKSRARQCRTRPDIFGDCEACYKGCPTAVAMAEGEAVPYECHKAFGPSINITDPAFVNCTRCHDAVNNTDACAALDAVIPNWSLGYVNYFCDPTSGNNVFRQCDSCVNTFTSNKCNPTVLMLPESWRYLPGPQIRLACIRSFNESDPEWSTCAPCRGRLDYRNRTQVCNAIGPFVDERKDDLNRALVLRDICSWNGDLNPGNLFTDCPICEGKSQCPANLPLDDSNGTLTEACSSAITQNPIFKSCSRCHAVGLGNVPDSESAGGVDPSPTDSEAGPSSTGPGPSPTRAAGCPGLSESLAHHITTTSTALLAIIGLIPCLV